MQGHIVLLALSLLATALLPSRVLAACNNYTDSYSQYAIQRCSLPSGHVPLALTNIINVTMTHEDDGVSQQIVLPFLISIYGVSWDRLYLSTNGVLFFGPTPSTLTTESLPVTPALSDSIPIIAPLWTDLYFNLESSLIQVSTEGLVGSRLFVVRFASMQWDKTRRQWPSVTVSFDVIFDEARKGAFDIVYHQYGSNPNNLTPKVTVGLQSYDDGGSSWTLFNQDEDWSQIQSTLVGQQLRFEFVGSDASQIQCGGLGYNFNSMRGMQLQYTDSEGTIWHYAPCGKVEAEACAGGATTRQSMLCQVFTTGVAVDLAIYGPNSVHYQYYPGGTGVQALYQASERCAAIDSDRFTIINYVCNSTAATAFITSASMTEVCVYTVILKMYII